MRMKKKKKLTYKKKIIYKINNNKINNGLVNNSFIQIYLKYKTMKISVVNVLIMKTRRKKD